MARPIPQQRRGRALRCPKLPRSLWRPVRRPGLGKLLRTVFDSAPPRTNRAFALRDRRDHADSSSTLVRGLNAPGRKRVAVRLSACRGGAPRSRFALFEAFSLVSGLPVAVDALFLHGVAEQSLAFIASASATASCSAASEATSLWLINTGHATVRPFQCGGKDGGSSLSQAPMTLWSGPNGNPVMLGCAVFANHKDVMFAIPAGARLTFGNQQHGLHGDHHAWFQGRIDVLERSSSPASRP